MNQNIISERCIFAQFAPHNNLDKYSANSKRKIIIKPINQKANCIQRYESVNCLKCKICYRLMYCHAGCDRNFIAKKKRHTNSTAARTYADHHSSSHGNMMNFWSIMSYTTYINDKLTRVQFIYNSMLFNYHTRSYTSQHRLKFKSRKKNLNQQQFLILIPNSISIGVLFFCSEQAAAYFYQESNNMSVSRKKRVLYFYGLFPLYLKQYIEAKKEIYKQMCMYFVPFHRTAHQLNAARDMPSGNTFVCSAANGIIAI